MCPLGTWWISIGPMVMKNIQDKLLGSNADRRTAFEGLSSPLPSFHCFRSFRNISMFHPRSPRHTFAKFFSQIRTCSFFRTSLRKWSIHRKYNVSASNDLQWCYQHSKVLTQFQRLWIEWKHVNRLQSVYLRLRHCLRCALLLVDLPG